MPLIRCNIVSSKTKWFLLTFIVICILTSQMINMEKTTQFQKNESPHFHRDGFFNTVLWKFLHQIL